MVIIQGARKLGTERAAFKEKLKQDPNILNATYTDSLPQMLLEVKVFKKPGGQSNINHTLITLSADHDFMDTYKLNMVEGRKFDKTFSTDSSAVILNPAAAKALDLESPLDKQLLAN